jgi:hypothetical protein
MLLVAAYPTLAGRNTKNDSEKAFLMEVSVAGRPTFRMPIKADEKRVAVIPMAGTTASAVKIVPTAKGDSLQFDLLAVVENLPETLSCDRIKTLKTEKVTSYVAEGNKSVQVSDFGKFGIGSFVVKVSLVPAATLLCPAGYCCCGTTMCDPNPGQCVECGNCGKCCEAGT